MTKNYSAKCITNLMKGKPTYTPTEQFVFNADTFTILVATAHFILLPWTKTSLHQIKAIMHVLCFFLYLSHATLYMFLKLMEVSQYLSEVG